MKPRALTIFTACLSLVATGFAADDPPAADNTPKPADATPQPADALPKAAADAPKAAADAPKPGADAPKPAADAPKPAADAPKTTADTPKTTEDQAAADDAAPEDPVAKHKQGSTKVADEQDELSADVQQLTIEQTIPKVIELFKEVEGIMDEATDWLAEYDTGGRTIAAQTEVIEKIHEATKERQKQQPGSQPGSAMMEMMEKMMEGEGEGKDGKEPGKKPGKKPGEKPGQGMTGDSDAANEATGAPGDGKSEVRRIPKAAGTAGHAIPEEFRKALDAYNRGLEKKTK